ncbi:MAG: SH3 domain-containing protein [Phycisphaerae bacterium]
MMIENTLRLEPLRHPRHPDAVRGMRRGVAIGCGRLLMLAASVLVSTAVADVPGEPPRASVLRYGVVIGDNVYVRSGPGANHYPVTKLSAGHRVRVVAETADWLEIAPPEGVFSLISAEYVDTADEKHGRLNGVNVRVRAGSSINKRRDKEQMLLSKGDHVTILGRTPDGFYRIEPPAGVTVWINRRFVNLLPDTTPHALPPAGSTGAGSTRRAAAGTPPAPDRAAPGAGTDLRDATRGTGADTPYLEELHAIDADTRAELGKPVDQRDLAPLIGRYRAVAERRADVAATRYARARVDELEHMAAQLEAVGRIRDISERMVAKRREFLAARAKMGQVLHAAAPVVGFDAQGELRVSAMYPGGAFPRRYRLVDPSVPHGRIIAYVEFPPDSTLRAEDYLGRYVGLRAARTRLQSGGVNPVPIYIASELVVLARNHAADANPGGTANVHAPGTQTPATDAANREAAGREHPADDQASTAAAAHDDARNIKTPGDAAPQRNTPDARAP